MLTALLSLSLSLRAKEQVKVAPVPDGVELKHDFEVRARVAGGEWQTLPTYAFRVDRVADARHNVEVTSVAKMEMEGRVEIEVKSLGADIQRFRIRPLSYGISASQEGNTLRFTLDRPRYLSVEVNGDIYHNLHLFADSIMERPKVGRKDLIYLGPGVHTFPGDSLAVASGKTVFLDHGAVVRGWLSVNGAENVTILGHGIIMPPVRHEGIMVRYSKNVHIDGPLTTQLPIGSSDSVTVRNCKVMS